MAAASRPLRAIGLRPSPTLAVGALTAAVSAVAAAAVTAAGPVPALAAPVSIPWWALALLFAAAEVCALHLHFRRDAYSISLSEIPVILGLLFAPAAALLAGQVAGAGCAWVLHRRQAIPKVLFNLATAILTTGLAVLVHRALLVGPVPVDRGGWVAGLAATEVAAVLTALLVGAAIAVSGQGMTRQSTLRLVAQAGGWTAASSGLALIVATVLWYEPDSLLLLPLPVLTIGLGYHRYSVERSRAAHLEFLYAVTEVLQEADEVAGAVHDLLDMTRETLRADLAEFVLLPPRGGDLAFRTRLRRGERPERMAPAPLDPVSDGVAALLSEQPAVLVTLTGHDQVLARFLRMNGLRDAVLAPLTMDSQMVGYLAFGNRPHEIDHLTADHRRLVAALAHNLSMAIENGRLHRSVAQLRGMERRLRLASHYDPLTLLPNGVLFRERLAAELRTPGQRGGAPGVILLGVDRLASVNRMHGRAGGDAVLQAVARRLTDVVEHGHLVARLDGDVLAILVTRCEGPAALEVLATAALQEVARPVDLGEGVIVAVVASAGLVADVAGLSAEQVLERADAAMHRAKAIDRGGHQFYRAGLHARMRARSAGGARRSNPDRAAPDLADGAAMVPLAEEPARAG